MSEEQPKLETLQDVVDYLHEKREEYQAIYKSNMGQLAEGNVPTWRRTVMELENNVCQQLMEFCRVLSSIIHISNPS